MKINSIENELKHDIYIGDVVELIDKNGQRCCGVVLCVWDEYHNVVVQTQNGNELLYNGNFIKRIKDNSLELYNSNTSHVFVKLYKNVGDDSQDRFKVDTKKVLVKNPYYLTNATLCLN